MKNPWEMKWARGGDVVEIVDVANRLDAIVTFDETKLRKVILWPETQKTVRTAAERRLRRLLNQFSSH